MTEPSSVLTIAFRAPAARCTDWPAFGPSRQRLHDRLELLDCADALRNLRHQLVVYTQHHRVAGLFEVDHGVGHNVAGHGLHDVFKQPPAEGFHTDPTKRPHLWVVVPRHKRYLELRRPVGLALV